VPRWLSEAPLIFFGFLRKIFRAGGDLQEDWESKNQMLGEDTTNPSWLVQASTNGEIATHRSCNALAFYLRLTSTVFFGEFQRFFVEQFWISPIDPFDEYRIHNLVLEP